MKLGKQIGAALVISAAMLVAAASAGAVGNPNEYRDGPQRGTALTSGKAAVAYFLANERATMTQSAGPSAIDFFNANERSTMAESAGPAAIVYFDANERATMTQSAGPSAIGFFRANERATMTQPVSTNHVSYVDGGERGSRPLANTSPLTDVEVSDTSGFDWSAAAIGASSTLLLALLIGASLIVVRHSRGRQLAG